MNKRNDNIVHWEKKSFNALDFFQYLMYNSWCSVCQGQKCHILMDWTVDMLDVCNAGIESSRHCVCIATYLHFYVFVFAFLCICIICYLYCKERFLLRGSRSVWEAHARMKSPKQRTTGAEKNHWRRFSSSLHHCRILLLKQTNQTVPISFHFKLFFCAVFTTTLYIFYENGCFGDSTLLFRLIVKIFQICER